MGLFMHMYSKFGKNPMDSSISKGQLRRSRRLGLNVKIMSAQAARFRLILVILLRLREEGP